MLALKFYPIRVAWITTALACFLSVSCNDDDQPEPEPDQTGILVQTDATFGLILTDSAGQALYFFSRDADGNSACAGNCLSLWPKYYSSHAASSEGIEDDDIGTITLADGSLQTTYKGWPLYYYAEDAAPGDVNGDGVGGNWFVAKPDYSVLLIQNQLIGNNGTAYKSDLTPGEGMTQYLVDAYGRTLYGFINDRYNTNNYTDPEFTKNAAWPIYESAVLTVPSTLNTEDFAEITVHGRMQLTYKGWPLYYFGQDAARGENKGISVPQPGVWPVLNGESLEAMAP